jgi:hypothetical protein
MAKDKEFQQTKTNIEPYTGGCAVNLKKKIKNKGPLREVLAREIDNVLSIELRNQAKLVKKIEKWNKQYRGIKPRRKATQANTAAPYTRSRVDSIAVRLIDQLSSQQKVWVLRPLEEWADELAPKLEDGLEWWRKHVADFWTTIFSPLLQCIKAGTGIVMVDYERRKKTYVRFATPEEKKDKKIKTFKTAEGELVVKVPQMVYDGPILRAISREDFLISSDATTIEDAHIVGYRTYVPRSTFDLRVKSKYYDISEEEAEKITGDNLDETKKQRISDSNKDYTDDVREKIEVWRLWYRYDVDNDKEEDDIIIDFHPESAQILKADYNHLFYGFRPFVPLIFNPVEFSFDGEGICPILEKIQEEIDTFHNIRIDFLHQTVIPVFKRRIGTDAENYKSFEPGTIVDTQDPETDLVMMQFNSGNLPGTIAEEQMLSQAGDEAIGNASAFMGQPTSERPVARETLALIQELNKKLKVGAENLRKQISKIGMMVIEHFAQFQPHYEYQIEKNGKQGKTFEKEALDFPFEIIRDGIAIDLMASSEVMNTEIQREIDLTLYQLLGDYYTKLAGMVEMLLSPEVPPDMKPLFVKWSKIFEKLMERIVRDFGKVDAETMVDSIPEDILQQALQQQMQQMVEKAVQQATQQQAQQFEAKLAKMQGLPPPMPPQGPGGPPQGPMGPQMGPPPPRM